MYRLFASLVLIAVFLVPDHGVRADEATASGY